MKITIYRTEYVPTDDGDRIIRREDEDTHEFDVPRELAEYLVKQGIDRPSSHPDYQDAVWWSDEPYHHPEGYTVEQTAHRDEQTVTDQQWHEVWVRLTGGPGDVIRHVAGQFALFEAKRYPNRTAVNNAVAGIARISVLALVQELGEHDDLRWLVEAYSNGLLDHMVVRHSPDLAKQDMELVHDGCQKVMFDVEPGDTLDDLLTTAVSHVCGTVGA